MVSSNYKKRIAGMLVLRTLCSYYKEESPSYSYDFILKILLIIYYKFIS